MIEEKGVQVGDDELHEDLIATMHECMPDIVNKYPPVHSEEFFGSSSSELKVSRSMKWEPAMIRYCQFMTQLCTSNDIFFV